MFRGKKQSNFSRPEMFPRFFGMRARERYGGLRMRMSPTGYTV